jgi:hypothetical protein
VKAEWHNNELVNTETGDTIGRVKQFFRPMPDGTQREEWQTYYKGSWREYHIGNYDSFENAEKALLKPNRVE